MEHPEVERDGAMLMLLIALVLLALVAGGVAGYLARERRTLTHRLEERSKQVAALGRIARTLGEAERATEGVRTVVDNAVETTRASGAYVERLREPDVPSDAEVVVAAGVGTPTVGALLSPDDALSAALVRTHETQLRVDDGANPAPPAPGAHTARGGFRLAIPLTDHGRVLGALVLVGEPGVAPLTPPEVSYACALGDLASSPLRRFTLLEALSESEQRFRQITENIREFVWLSDPQITTRYHYVSAGYERIWGRSVESLYDDPKSALRAVHPDDRKRVEAVALSGGLPLGHYDIEYRVIRPDGEIRWVHGRGFPVRNERGEIYRIAGITEDITERKRAELEREHLLASERAARATAEEARAIAEQRRRELERVSESRARLVRGFTHDVKNPLAAADGALELLEDGLVGALSPQQIESVHRVRHSIRTALDLIDHLLELERAEAGRLEIERAPTDLRAVVTEVTEGFRAQAQKRSLTLTVDVAPGLPTIESDATRIWQILANLISNAVKYTPAGGRVAVCAAVRARLDGAAPPWEEEWIAVDVADTGPGISAEQQALLFQEFTRFDPGAAHGSGIGLAISQRVARALGGEIRVKCEEGTGCTFTLWLPVEGA